MAAEQSEKSPLQGSDTPDYNALFGREQKSQKFAQKTVFGDVRRSSDTCLDCLLVGN